MIMEASEALGENGENKSTISKHIKIICDELHQHTQPF